MEDASRAIRIDWVNALIRRGFSETVAVVLDAVKPLSYFSAQLVYTGQPILSRFIPDRQIEAACEMLDDSDELECFIEMLKLKT
jgi:hypothetical protein